MTACRWKDVPTSAKVANRWGTAFSCRFRRDEMLAMIEFREDVRMSLDVV